jgi:MFS family permease
VKQLNAERKQLLWFAGGVALGLLAEQTVLFAVPLLVYQSTANVAYSGVAFALEWLPALIAYPFAGLMADLLGGRRTFQVANSARALCLLITLIACWRFPGHIVVALMINSVFLSSLMAPMRTAMEKTVASLGSRTDLATRQSLVQNIELLSMATAPGIAAAMASVVGKLPLLGIAASSLACAALAWSMLPKLPQQPFVPRRIGPDLRLGWKLMIHNRAVFALGGVNFLVNLVAAVVLSANAYLVTGLFGAKDGVFGLMNTGAGALGLINLLLIPHMLRWWSIYQLGATGYLLMCASLVCMGIAPNVWAYASAYIGLIAGAAIYNVFNRTQRVKAIEPEHLGKVIGPFYLISGLAYPLGGIVTAILGRVFGVQHMVLFLALLLALPGAALLQLTSRLFREAIPEPPRAALVRLDQAESPN